MTMTAVEDRLDDIEVRLLSPMVTYKENVTEDALALVAALRAVLALHKPKAPASAWDMVSWTSCSCGATEVTSRIDGRPSVAPAEYPCQTVRAVTAALGVTL